MVCRFESAPQCWPLAVLESWTRLEVTSWSKSDGHLWPPAVHCCHPQQFWSWRTVMPMLKLNKSPKMPKRGLTWSNNLTAVCITHSCNSKHLQMVKNVCISISCWLQGSFSWRSTSFTCTLAVGFEQSCAPWTSRALASKSSVSY